MGRFVKPILNMLPPDPTSLDPRELASCCSSSSGSSACSRGDQYNQVQLMTMSAVDFLDQWFETDVLKATMSASGIIGTFLGVRSPGTAYVLLHHYMGEIDGAFRSWGLARGGTGAISNAIADAAREAGVEIRTERGGGAASWSAATSAHGRRARERRRARRRRRRVERRSAADVPALPRRAARCRTSSSTTSAATSSAARRARSTSRSTRCRISPRLPGAGAAPARRHLDLAERRLHGARLRRGEVRPVLAAPVHRHRHPVADRSRASRRRAST